MSCSQTLNGILKDCAASMGGIVEVYLANFSDVSAVTVTDNIISAISMNASATFKKYQFRRNTGSLTKTLNIDPANGVNYVSSDLVLQFSRMDAAKRIEMSALALNELVAIVKDANGEYWYLGYDEPLSASAGDGQTGTARSDGNRYSITLQDNAKTWPYPVEATIIEALLG